MEKFVCFQVDDNYVKKLSAQEQLFGTSPDNTYDMYSNFNFEDQPILPKDDAPLSPVYQSEAARQIVQELSKKDQNDNIKQNESLTKRLVPREKRRHHTVTSVRPLSITEPYNVNKQIIIYSNIKAYLQIDELNL